MRLTERIALDEGVRGGGAGRGIESQRRTMVGVHLAAGIIRRMAGRYREPIHVCAADS